jgi:hypothetical protein
MMKKIDNIPDKNPFRVPDGYFDEVNRKIIGATSGKISGERKSALYNRLRPFLLAAASITGIILLSYTAFRLVNGHKSNRHEAIIINEDYYSPFINDLDIYSIEENAATVAIPDQGPDVSKAEIIDYLVLDNIDIDEIYEQL